MGWRFPKHFIHDPQVIEMDDLNEDFRPFVEEASGALNEHNWKRDAFDGRAQLADDVAVVLHNEVVEANSNANPTVTANIMFVTSDIDWEDIEGLETTFTTTGGTYWVLASIQGHAPIYKTYVFGSLPANGRFGLQFALSLNAAVLAQSIVGSGDLMNDKIGSLDGAVPKGAAFYCWQTTGISSQAFSVVSEAIITVPPGTHTVKALVTPPQTHESNPAANNPGARTKFLATRELIVVELLR
jgi:hypothetical protein